MLRQGIKKGPLSEPANDLDYWITRSPAERLASLETLRERYSWLKAMELQKDFKEFIVLLDKHDVAYLIVGGFAVAAHGYPRFTGDIDFWVKVDPENARRVVAALQEFGFSGPDISEADFLRPNYVVQLGYPPNRIDLLTSVTGLEFDECWQVREIVEVDGTPLNFLSLAHLKLNKRLAGRKKDELDLDNLP
jgi:hypothetical protein